MVEYALENMISPFGISAVWGEEDFAELLRFA
jgi:hypothetical protein